ncbi:heavy metal translocating P-type ATPase metal-binding domain-containing protein [Endothiovibrio diazotrophicus]
MSDLPCDLCALPVEHDVFPVRTAEGTLHFCCDGCRGIYRMLHQPQELPDDGIAPAAERNDGE